MRTSFHTKQPYADRFIECAKNMPCVSPARPLRFIEKMNSNRGSISGLSGFGLDEDNLERKNPLIVALGDSVTAGHFESLLPEEPTQQMELMKETEKALRTGDWSSEILEKYIWKSYGKKIIGGMPPIEIVDARESYIEKFREKLLERFEWTSVSVLNAGIAGDNLRMMAARAERDVLRYQPDLVLINGVLNWSEELGSTEEYKQILTDLVARIKRETEADIILITPNGDLPNPTSDGSQQETTTHLRVKAVREVAEEQHVCLADVYAVWEKAREAGCPWKELLANGMNHPSVEGHEVYAIVLMKLIGE